MGRTNVKLLWDKEADLLEVVWSDGSGSYEPTDDDQVMELRSNDGDTLGFMVLGMSTFAGFPAKTFSLGSFTPSNDITTTGAALELGVSAQRIRQLAKQNRIVGARRIGREWIIPSPVQIAAGTKGPVGVAGPRR